MLYTLENDKVRAVISNHGAELQSLVKLPEGREYIWQRDEKYWNRCAILLFPVCGRLKDKQYRYAGKTYTMDIHGFLKDSDLAVSEMKDDSVTFTLTENETTLKQYPFRFRLSVTYTLENSTLRHFMKVENTDEKELIFSLGGHPGFNVPLELGETFEDYTIRFLTPCAPRKLCMSDSCLYLGKTEPYPLENGILPLHHNLFDDDAIFLTEVSDTVMLSSRKSSCFVTVSYPGFRNLGFWHAVRSEAPYLCIEPWTSTPAIDGVVDDLETKNQMEHLVPGGTYTMEFTVTIG